MSTVHKGSCLCGCIRFEVNGAIGAPDACHCQACRKHSGHYFASGNVPRNALTIQGVEHLAWYRSSEMVRRGFCSKCGSSLFWDPPADRFDWIAVAMGAFDTPTEVQLHCHIFVAEKGDYYAIEDTLPQKERF